MSILWCGGEDIDFPNSPTAVVQSTNASYFRTGYARSALAVSGGTPRNVSSAFPGGAITSGWISVYHLQVLGFTASRRMVGFCNLTPFKGIYWGISAASTTRAALFTYDGSTLTQLVAEAGNSLVAAELAKFDFQMISYGGSGTLNLYRNGVLLVTYTGDISISGEASFGYVSVESGKSDTIGHYSEIIVADADTRLLSLVTMAPNGAGDASTFEGASTDIDEVNVSDADNMYSDATGEACQIALTTIPAGNFSVLHVRAAARAAMAATATPHTLKLGVKSTSIDVDAGRHLTTAWVTYERDMPVNPVTTNPWLDTEMAGLQLAMESAA